MDSTPEALNSAETVERIDVEAVNRRRNQSLYAPRKRIHPKRAHGVFRRLKWLVMLVTLTIYYVTPWIRWDRGPSAPDQAVLIDFPARRFYFFFIEIWPQEVYYLTGLLILAAITLFLVTSIAGRVWCGYSCPQTVWTDLFIAVERFVEGDRNARLRLDKTPWNASKIAKKIIKHIIWLLIAVATGGAWVFYFDNAPTLAMELFTGEATPTAYLFVGIFTFTTYMLGAIAREQVCTYMCPWPRIQGAMMDEESLVVSYHPARGEPRGPHKRGETWEGRGHCVDCNQCVAVCPTGIDIRDGQQLECITCALCIDACDEVMQKLDLPKGLISYDTIGNMERKAQGLPTKYRPIRPRTIFYAVVIAIVGSIMLYTLLTRSSLDVNVLRDRNPLFVRLSDGDIRNGYTIKILNKLHAERHFTLGVQGLANARLNIIGSEGKGDTTLIVPADQLRSFRVFVTAPRADLTDKSMPIVFRVTDTRDGNIAIYDAVFRGPHERESHERGEHR